MIQYDFPQYSPAYWAVRRGKATSSNFHRIITAKKGELAAAHKTYIAELIGDELNPGYPDTDAKATAAMLRGTQMEPEARALYELWAGETVEQVGFLTTDCGRFGDSPDGLVGGEGITEYKCPSAAVFASWVIEGVLPEDHKAQCHGHLLVSGRKWCDLFAYYPGQEPFIVRVVPDDFTEKLRECLIKFDREYQSARAKFGLSSTSEPCSFVRPSNGERLVNAAIAAGVA